MLLVGHARACAALRAPGKVFVAPNFAIGAVLMMQFAAEASKHMAAAEIVARDDVHASAAYRRQVGARLVDQVVRP